jgi:hypothetical protein
VAWGPAARLRGWPRAGHGGRPSWAGLGRGQELHAGLRQCLVRSPCLPWPAQALRCALGHSTARAGLGRRASGQRCVVRHWLGTLATPRARDNLSAPPPTHTPKPSSPPGQGALCHAGRGCHPAAQRQRQPGGHPHPEEAWRHPLRVLPGRGGRGGRGSRQTGGGRRMQGGLAGGMATSGASG